MSQKLTLAFAAGLVVLGVALFVPTLIDSTQEDAIESAEIEQGSLTELTDVLSITASNVNESAGEATVEYRNERTFNETSVTLNETDPPENKTIQLSGENITAELNEISDNTTAIVTSENSPMFGWDEGSRTFMGHLDLILAALGLAIVSALIVVAFKS